MSQQFTPTLLNVVAQFQKQGLNGNSSYTREQYFSTLDKMCGIQFDRTVAEQLFEQCQVNFKQQVALEDFCQVLIEADKILKRKISQTEESIAQNNRETKECQKQLQDAQNFQRFNQLNSLGVEKDSLLSILIHNAQNILTREDFQQSYVVITVGNYKHTSNPPQGGDKLNPQYDQQFQFNIETGQEEVEIRLYLQGRANQQILQGLKQIELGDLHDQQVHEINLQLQDTYGNINGTTLFVEVQWIYNKVLFYQDLLVKYKENLEQLNLDLEDYRRDSAIVQQPLLGGTITQPKQINSQQGYNIQPQILQQQNITQQKPQLQQSRQQGQGSEELRLGFLLILIMGIFSLLESFTRTEFLDLLLFMLMMIIVVLDYLNESYIKYVGGINIATVIYDINEWDSTDKSNPIFSALGQGICRFTITICIFNIITKVYLYNY